MATAPLPLENDRLSTIEQGQKAMAQRQDEFDQRLKVVENIGTDVTAILNNMNKLGKQLRIWAPAIVGAAISAGVVNGKLGAFLHALLNGIN